MTRGGLRGLARAAPFLASLAAALVATGIESAGHALLLPATARVRNRPAGVTRDEAIEKEDPDLLASASSLLPFDASPRRWRARALARDDSTGDAHVAAPRTEDDLHEALEEGLERRPRDPVLLYLAGEAALRRGDDVEADRLRFAAVRVGAVEGWIVARFAVERFSTGRAREAAAAEALDRASRLAEAGDAPAAAALRERAARETAGARRAFDSVVRLPDLLSPEVRRRSDVDRIAAEAAKDLAELGRAP